MKTIAAGDVIALQDLVTAIMAEVDLRPVAVEIRQPRDLRLEQQRLRRLKPGPDQVLNHFLLTVDHHPLAGQAGKIEMDVLAAKANVEAFINHALSPHPRVQSEHFKSLHRARLEHAGAHTPFDIRAALGLDDDTFYSGPVQQMRQEKPGRSGTNDSNLRSHLQTSHRIHRTTDQMHSLVEQPPVQICSRRTHGTRRKDQIRRSNYIIARRRPSFRRQRLARIPRSSA
ncbi:hypothetical protein ACVWXQ_009581 [Bradyrhizobium sp. S3.14.4]